MNRPIKFRAWSKPFEKMLCGSYENQYNDCRFMPYGYGLGNDSLEVMQFTGLVDKDGLEVYEGDIVEYVQESPISDEDLSIRGVGEVIWNEEMCGFVIKYMFRLDIYLDLKIIGNIYENPELLKP